MKKIVIATQNENKLKEFKEIFNEFDLDFELVSLKDLGVTDEAPEDGDTFLSNAVQKANFYKELTGLPCISEDAGLEIEALDNAPGVYSARWSGEHSNHEENNRKLVRELTNLGLDRSKARYVSVMVFKPCGVDYHIDSIGTLEGIVKTNPSGTNGFGYDPYFYIDNRSIADMSDEEKNKISHRGKAARGLVNNIKNLLI